MSLLTGAERSAAEVARELKVTQANASYHLRVLAGAGLIEVHGTEKVRGGVAKKYRYVIDYEERLSDAGLLRGTGAEEEFPMFAAALASELQRRATRYAADSKGPGNTFTDLETWIEEDVWADVLDLVRRAGRLAHQNARPPRSAGTIPVSFIASLFRMHAPEEPRP